MKINRWAMGAAAVLSLIGASSASAANWDPQNTNVTATQEGSGTLTAGSASVTCSAGSTTLRASGAVATTVGTVNPVNFTSCVGPSGQPATVTTFGDWHFIANSTTSVTVTATPTASNNKVATIHIGGFFNCDLTITGHQALPNNVWSNANRTLSVNGPVSNIENSGGLCALAGSSGTIVANFQAAAGTTIT
jgi:hypothetical protein